LQGYVLSRDGVPKGHQNRGGGPSKCCLKLGVEIKIFHGLRF